MATYPPELKILLKELHITRLIKYPTEDDKSFEVNFVPKGKKLRLYYSISLKIDEIFNVINPKKQEILDYYEKSCSLLKLPIQTEFKTLEVLGIKIKYVLNDECFSYNYTFEPKNSEFIVCYKSIYSTKVDEYVDSNLIKMAEIAKRYTQAKKEFEENQGKITTHSTIIPYSVDRIPVRYQVGLENKNLKIRYIQKLPYFNSYFNQEFGCFDIIVNPELQNFVIYWLAFDPEIVLGPLQYFAAGRKS